MSTPLFTREVSNGDVLNQSYLGGSLSSWGGISWTPLTAIGEEPLLVEEIWWSAQDYNTDGGTLAIALDDGAGSRHLLRTDDLEAGGVSSRAGGMFKMSFAIQIGYRLVVAHDVQANGAGGYVNLSFVVNGGIIR